MDWEVVWTEPAVADLESVPQAPLSPVLRGEGLGVRGENPRETQPLSP
jgi:hypothetical protein